MILKRVYAKQLDFDHFDLLNFYSFFKNLYAKRCTKVSHGDLLMTDSNKPNQETLNTPFTLSEIENLMAKLKNNKSGSTDLISNEMLKNLSPNMKKVLCNLFNSCLLHEVYPWNESVTTPLHKKGDQANPDNYRAITLGSCLGKLFSSALLQRLTQFRKQNCPDLPNQLGFCPGAHCPDK